MKTSLKHLLSLLTVALSAFCCYADSEPNDTVFFYKTWEQMLDMKPMAMLINPYVEVYTPFELFIGSNDETVNRVLSEEGFIAISLGDSIWYANSEYLHREFKGDVNEFTNFVPLFFNEKVAYLTYPGKLSVKDLLMGDDYSENYTIDYFYIDFMNSRVKRVTHKYLSELLEDYHDLQMRYEGMKDYKKRPIIEDYFFKYVQRATGDIMHPAILDVVE